MQKPDRIRTILIALDSATRPEDLNLPGLRFHGLKGKPKRYAVDASGNYRITFGWDGENVIDVDLEDYH
ncbi:MAG: type II toxin-antitoxin system RelE/ParE family toxin [Sphingomonadales bacterium]|nr:type II toxin-antitoxin system RelE/ParE family toxin [Sphingomonadales bacterium]